jgi:hypothetical protein
MARTRADLEAQIADDLARSDLTDQITLATDWALQYYQDDRFYFNELAHASVTLSSSIDYIALASPPMPYRFQKIDRLRIEITSSASAATQTYYEVAPQDYASIMESQDNRAFSRPCYYCVYGDQIVFDVAADTNYTLNIDGVIHLGSAASASFSSGDTGAWFNDARELIRSAVKRNLYGHVIKDDRMAAMCVEAEQDAYSMLKGQTTRKKSTGKVRPNYF